MNILQVPFHFDREEFNKRIHIELYEGMEEEIESFLERAVPLLKPKAVFRETGVRRRETGEILIDEQVFSDPVLISHMENKDSVFPYIVSCGDELEELVTSSGDMLEVFWYDALKQMAMDQAFNYLRINIKENFDIPKLYSLNPGSDACGEGWDLGDQKKLFTYFPDVEKKIGVMLTDSMLMYPNKTVSGLMFESDMDFVSCQECSNIQCPNRKIMHEGALYS